MKLTKCFGIISWFPDEEPLRSNRKKKFKILLEKLNTYFKLPIVIVAQNWREEDFNLKYGETIKIYNYSKQLGITGARIELRKWLLEEDCDYFILLDDDTDLRCTKQGADEFMRQLDAHPDKFGLFKTKDRCWHRLFSISKTMLKLMSYDFIKDYESIRGEIWEDVAYVQTYKVIYPKSWFINTARGIDEKQTPSEKDPDSTWYKPEFESLSAKTQKIKEEWIKSLQ